MDNYRLSILVTPHGVLYTLFYNDRRCRDLSILRRRMPGGYIGSRVSWLLATKAIHPVIPRVAAETVREFRVLAAGNVKWARTKEE